MALGSLFSWTPLIRLPPSRLTFIQRDRMPHSITLSVRRVVVILLAGTLGCGSDLLLPDTAGERDGIVALTKVKGDDQTGRVGEMLQSPLVVKVLGVGEQPASGVEVSFELSDSIAGTIDPAVATTNSAGEAVAHWTFGTVPGSYKVIARVVGTEDTTAAEFIAAAEPGAPDTLSSLIPLAQPGRREQQVGDPPLVQVVDRFGNPVPNVPVAWQVIAGEGTVSSPITTTNAEGQASIDWTLGDRFGVHKLTAAIESASGSPVTFTATVFF